MDNLNIIEKLVGFEEDIGGGLIIRETQLLPDDYISELKQRKIDTLHTPMGDFLEVCEIPTGIADKWHRQGFDVMREPIREIIKRLQQEHLDAFITTSKRVF